MTDRCNSAQRPLANLARVRTRYTDEQKAEAIKLVAEVGTAEASRRTGINPGTIGSWATRAGVPAPDPVSTAKAVGERISDTAERRTRLAEALIEDADRLRQQLFAPTVRRDVKVVSGGQMREGRVEIVDVHLTQPTFADQRHIAQSIATLLDKALVMLGEATARVEQLTATPRTPEVEAEVAKVLSLVRSA